MNGCDDIEWIKLVLCWVDWLLLLKMAMKPRIFFKETGNF